MLLANRQICQKFVPLNIHAIKYLVMNIYSLIIVLNIIDRNVCIAKRSECYNKVIN